MAIVSVLIDTWVISGYVFKELGIFTAKLVREETKEAIESLETNVGLLERNIKASNSCNFYIKELFSQQEVCDDIESNNFDFIDKFRLLLLKYYKDSQLDITLEIKLYKNEDIDNIVNSYKCIYNLNYRDIKDIKTNLKGIGSIAITKNDNMIMFVTLDASIYPEDRILVAMKSNDAISRYDEFMIENLLRMYESEFLLTAYSLIEEE